MHFIIWFQDYRARYLNEQDTEARESALQSKEQRENSTQFSETTQDICEEYSTAVSSGALEGVNSLGSDVSSQLRNGNILDYGSRASIEGQRKKQAFRSEVNNILATFLVPDARKELLLCSSMRDKAISDAKQSTDPDIVSKMLLVYIPFLTFVLVSPNLSNNLRVCRNSLSSPIPGVCVNEYQQTAAIVLVCTQSS